MFLLSVGPALVSSPSSVVVAEHNATILTCEFTGNPQPSIIWEKEGGNLPPMTRRDIDFIPSPNATSILGRVSAHYICFIVTNTSRKNNSSMKILLNNVIQGRIQDFERGIFYYPHACARKILPSHAHFS